MGGDSFGGCYNDGWSYFYEIGDNQYSTQFEVIRDSVYGCQVKNYNSVDNDDLDNEYCAEGYHICSDSDELESLGVTRDMCESMTDETPYMDRPRFFMTEETTGDNFPIGCGSNRGFINEYCSNSGCDDRYNLVHDDFGILNSYLNGSWIDWTLNDTTNEIISFRDNYGGVMCCKDENPEEPFEVFIQSVCSGKYLDCLSSKLFLKDHVRPTDYQRIRMTNDIRQDANEYNLHCSVNGFAWGYVSIEDGQLWKMSEAMDMTFDVFDFGNGQLDNMKFTIHRNNVYWKANNNQIELWDVSDESELADECYQWTVRPVRKRRRRAGGRAGGYK